MTEPITMTNAHPQAFTPVTDPTFLTTQNLQREISAAVMLLRAEMDGNQRERESATAGMKADFEQRFSAIQAAFDANESFRREQKGDTQKAVDAALQAAKEAVGNQQLASAQANAKTESAVADQLKQLNMTFTAELKGMRDQMDDIKIRMVRVESTAVAQQANSVILEDLRDRMSRSEAMKVGAVEHHANARLDLGALVGVVGVAIAIISFVISVILITR